ncbi:MAG: 4Fe-4S binding protein [Chloroflexi bacterium]|nr:4Fe-4S binding protein [Chloroflexota bacterium]
MAHLQNHPTVLRFKRERAAQSNEESPRLADATLRELCLDSGADDVGFVSIDRAELDNQRAEILENFPWARSLISIVCRMNREPIRSPARSVANLEFHHTVDHAEAAAHTIVAALEAQGVRAANPASGFPMEVERFPGKSWIISHKPVAVAAGLGQMGIHRNVIHPRFGNFILLGTIVTDAVIGEESKPIDYNPCLECKLCVAACPVGAISPSGDFDFGACFTHNYREFMGGFNDWVETLVSSKDAPTYYERTSASETASMWQSLSFGASYKAAYCIAVCPAGDDVIAPFLTNRAGFLKEVVKPLQDKVETIYVSAETTAAYVRRRFPHKRVKRVGSGIRFSSVESFVKSLPRVFRPAAAEGVNAIYHLVFSGAEDYAATISIGDGPDSRKRVMITEGCVGHADLRIAADSQTWLAIVAGDRTPAWALIRRKLRLRGSLRLMKVFRACFAA